MQHLQLVEPNYLAEGVHRLRIRVSVSQIVAGDKNVACVEANTDAVFIFNEVDHAGDLFERAAQRAALTGCRLKEKHRMPFWLLGKDAVDRFANTFDPNLYAVSHVRARMRNKVRHIELIT